MIINRWLLLLCLAAWIMLSGVTTPTGWMAGCAAVRAQVAPDEDDADGAPAITPRPAPGAPEGDVPIVLAPGAAGAPAAITPVTRTAATPAASPRGLRILSVNDGEVATLRELNAGSDVQAVTLGAGQGALRADPAAWQALVAWVRGGGTVLLHNDAAQLFGYQTVPLREALPAVAGQRFGRARAALPFGASPLLWRMPAANAPAGATAGGAPGGARPVSGPPFGAALGAASVRVVYYQMEEGDHLVVAHPAGVPLLRVTDLALPPARAAAVPAAMAASRAPLYAAAIAPFGRGWAVFTPTLVEQHRADGAAFVRNLLRLAGASRRAPAGGAAADGRPNAAASNTAFAADALVVLPAALVEGAADAAGRPDFDLASLADDFAAVAGGLPTDGNRAEAVNADGAPPAALRPGLLLSPFDVAATARLLDTVRAGTPTNAPPGGPVNAAAQARAVAMLCLLRMRLELQRGDLAGAAVWLDNAETAAADAAETLLWRGVLAMAQSADTDTPGLATSGEPAVPRRAALLDEAAASWSRALTAGSLLGAAAASANAGGGNGNLTAPPQVGGVPRALLASWIADVETGARLAALEPPVQLAVAAGRDGTTGLVVRHDGSRETLRVLPSLVARLNAVSATLGWRADAEELMIFPSVAAYTAYRNAIVAASFAPADRAPGAGFGADGGEPGDGAGGNGATGFRFPPWTRFSDAVGTRVLMVTPARQDLRNADFAARAAPDSAARRTPNLNRGRGGRNAPAAPLVPGTVSPMLSRLHARVLVHALAQGGAPVPEWMLIGLAALGEQRSSPVINVAPRATRGTLRNSRRGNNSGASVEIGGRVRAALDVAALRRELRKLARAGRLLAPDEFAGMPSDVPVTALVDAQALGLMQFFYRQFGAGRVVETLQRLGAGQAADEALVATTGLTQNEFFAAWQRADLGAR